MINEANLYKTVYSKDFVKTKYLLSKLLKDIYNALEKEEKYGATKRFTIITEAIYYMLSETKPHATWYDYSVMLETAYKQNSDFPSYLMGNFEQIKHSFHTCPIVAKHSNESLLIGIVEKLIRKCVENVSSTEMDVDDTDDAGSVVAMKKDILKLIGQPMVNYGTLDRLPDIESVNGPFFMSDLARFVSQLNVDIEVVKRIVQIIPLEFTNPSNALRQCETALLQVLETCSVKTLVELSDTIRDGLKELMNINSPTLQGLFKSVNQLQLDYSTLQRTVDLKPDLDCEVGAVAVHQFQTYSVEYIIVNESNKYNFYLNALHAFARCYIMSLEPEFYHNSPDEYQHCKIDQNYFTSKLNAYVEFSGEQSNFKESVEFKNEVFYYVGSQTGPECIQTLKLMAEIYKVPNLKLVYSETKILFELIGINGNGGGVTTFVNWIKAFLTKFGSNSEDFPQTMLEVEELLALIGPNKSAAQCTAIIRRLITIGGANIQTVEEIEIGVQKVKEVYNRRLPEEQFSVANLSFDLESFINNSDTDKYAYIPGETNNQKLDYVHKNLTEPLQRIFADSSSSYSVLMNFLKQLLVVVGGKEGEKVGAEGVTTKLDKLTLEVVLEKNKQFKTLEEEKNTLATRLTSQKEQLEQCIKRVEDYKVKYEIGVGTNKSYAEKIKQLEEDCAKSVALRQEHESMVEQLNELKKEHSILKNTYTLVQQQFNDLKARKSRKVATVKPKKRKMSERESESDTDFDDINSRAGAAGNVTKMD